MTLPLYSTSLLLFSSSFSDFSLFPYNSFDFLSTLFLLLFLTLNSTLLYFPNPTSTFLTLYPAFPLLKQPRFPCTPSFLLHLLPFTSFLPSSVLCYFSATLLLFSSNTLHLTLFFLFPSTTLTFLSTFLSTVPFLLPLLSFLLYLLPSTSLLLSLTFHDFSTTLLPFLYSTL